MIEVEVMADGRVEARCWSEKHGLWFVTDAPSEDAARLAIQRLLEEYEKKPARWPSPAARSGWRSDMSTPAYLHSAASLLAHLRRREEAQHEHWREEGEQFYAQAHAREVALFDELVAALGTRAERDQLRAEVERLGKDLAMARAHIAELERACEQGLCWERCECAGCRQIRAALRAPERAPPRPYRCSEGCGWTGTAPDMDQVAICPAPGGGRSRC